MKKVILTVILLTSVSFAKTDKKSDFQCYRELLGFFQNLKMYVGNDIVIFLDIAKMMKEDGYSCKEIKDFLEKKK